MKMTIFTDDLFESQYYVAHSSELVKQFYVVVKIISDFYSIKKNLFLPWISDV